MHVDGVPGNIQQSGLLANAFVRSLMAGNVFQTNEQRPLFGEAQARHRDQQDHLLYALRAPDG